MSSDTVMITLVTADRTRKAQVSVPRSMYISDVIKASTKRWFLSYGLDYVVCNLTTNRQLTPGDSLSFQNVSNGDVLMLQPFASHGAA